MESKSGLRIIGAGLPRTGTTSLTAALEILGFKPTLHAHGGWAAQWEKLLDAQASSEISTSEILKQKTGIDITSLLAPYQATLDSPAIDFYAELMTTYPDAKVLLSVRDSDEKWWDSWYGTFGKIYDITWTGTCLRFLTLPLRLRESNQMGLKIVMGWRRKYGVYGPQTHLLHNQRVKQQVPVERLLEYNVKEGWPKLCEFLEVPIPDKPFPNLNDSKFTRAIINRKYREGAITWACFLATVGVSMVLAKTMVQM